MGSWSFESEMALFAAQLERALEKSLNLCLLENSHLQVDLTDSSAHKNVLRPYFYN